MILEKGERCECGGEIDIRYRISRNPDIRHGRCFQCNEPCTVVQRLNDSGG